MIARAENTAAAEGQAAVGWSVENPSNHVGRRKWEPVRGVRYRIAMQVFGPTTNSLLPRLYETCNQNVKYFLQTGASMH